MKVVGHFIHSSLACKMCFSFLPFSCASKPQVLLFDVVPETYTCLKLFMGMEFYLIHISSDTLQDSDVDVRLFIQGVDHHQVLSTQKRMHNLMNWW
jgi:hypothetical protein